MKKFDAVVLLLVAAISTVFAACTEHRPLSGEDRVGFAYLSATVPPCMPVKGAEPDSCAIRSGFEPQGLVPFGIDPGKEPRTFVEVLNAASPDSAEPYRVTGIDLLRVKHIVVRGAVKQGSTRCESYPVLYPAWALSEDHSANGPGDFEHRSVGSWRHLMCFSDVEIYEYFVGTGPPELIVAHDPLTLPYDSKDTYDSEVNDVSKGIAEIASSVVGGNEWVFWLSPSHTSALVSWRVTEYWDVQKNEEDEVVVVSPDFDWFSKLNDNGFELGRHSLLAPTIAEFRQGISKAHSDRTARTDGRIGVGTHTPTLVTDANRLSDYFLEFNAYQHPEVTPAAPPPAP